MNNFLFLFIVILLLMVIYFIFNASSCDKENFKTESDVFLDVVSEIDYRIKEFDDYDSIAESTYPLLDFVKKELDIDTEQLFRRYLLYLINLDYDSLSEEMMENPKLKNIIIDHNEVFTEIFLELYLDYINILNDMLNKKETGEEERFANIIATKIKINFDKNNINLSLKDIDLFRDMIVMKIVTFKIRYNVLVEQITTFPKDKIESFTNIDELKNIESYLADKMGAQYLFIDKLKNNIK